LAAQRDMLRRLKEEKRQKELSEFNDKLDAATEAPSKPNLAEELKQLDANKQKPLGAASVGAPSLGNPELDRRRMIYKNIRKEINDNEQVAK